MLQKQASKFGGCPRLGTFTTHAYKEMLNLFKFTKVPQENQIFKVYS